MDGEPVEVGQGGDHLVEPGELPAGVGIAGLVGDGEMGEDPRQAKPWRLGGDGRDQRRHVRRGGADAVHPGVHLDMDIDVVDAVCTGGGQRVDGVHGGHRRDQPVGDDRRRRGRSAAR